MQPLKPQLTPDLTDHVGSREVWRAPAFPVSTYRELVEHVAKLSYANRNQLLFFRGQDQDYQSRAGGSTLYPAIYRVENLQEQELEYRFRELEAASRSLAELFREEGIDGAQDVARKRYIQWSILQHYDVVPTPLLDITHSLRVACSFTGFDAMPEEALYPPDDQIERLCQGIQRGMWSFVNSYLRPPEHGGELILEWGRAEERLLDEARRLTSKNLPVGRAIDQLVQRGKLSKDTAGVLHRVRRVRNMVAHKPSQIEPDEIMAALQDFQSVAHRLPHGGLTPR